MMCGKDIYLLFLSIIILYLFYYKQNKKEKFDTTTDIKTAINQIYNADVEAIRNLSNIATKLIAGGIDVPGNIKSTTISTNILTLNEPGGNPLMINNTNNSWLFNNYPNDNKLIIRSLKDDGNWSDPIFNLGKSGTLSMVDSIYVDNTNKVGNTSKGMIETNYGGNGDRYGIGQGPNGAMRMYCASAFKPATVNLSVAKSDGSFDDIITVNTDGITSVKGNLFSKSRLIFGNSHDNVSSTISDSNFTPDSLCIVGQGTTNRKITMWDNVQITNKLSTNNLDPNNMPDGWGGGLRFFDGYSSGTLGFGPDGKKLNATIDNNGYMNVQRLYIRGGTNNNPGGPNNPHQTHFPWEGDGNNYIRGDTIVNGNINLQGNFTSNNARIGGGIGAYLVDRDYSTHAIFSSTSNFSQFGMNDKDDNYILLPGYKINIYTNYGYGNDGNDNGNNPFNSWDNTNGFTSIYCSLANHFNEGSSCRLYYLGNEVIINGIS